MKILAVNCTICDNTGLIFAEDGSLGFCKCCKEREAIRRLEQSGLRESVEKYDFDNFVVKEPWQKAIKDMVLEYAEKGANNGYWLYLGGQPGAGKSHLATAVIGKLYSTRKIHYAVWPITAQKLKAAAMKPDVYDELITPLQEADVLIIDDMFKPGRDRNGVDTGATTADIHVAFDIINYRYVKGKTTIISSEWFLSEMAEFDEAVASRIYEKCGKYIVSIKRDKKRNHRYVTGLEV